MIISPKTTYVGHPIFSDATQYVRTVDFDGYKYEGYECQMLYVGEDCRVIASSVAAGGAAPKQHVHEADQLYFVTHGEMHVQLGAEEFVVGPEMLVFIPAGTPHHNWNEGPENEFHFEVLAPGPDPNTIPWEETESIDAGGRAYFVRPLAGIEIDPQVTFFDRRFLIQRTDGSEHVMLYEAATSPGGGHPELHYHNRNNQFYYVLDGELTVEIALDRAVVPRHSLVVLPAGVPHRVWNDGSVRSRHLSMITPAPTPGIRGDIPVHFGTTEQPQP
jgi:mannose-6-phosphate isomerase-like protein (cupin superfamily)